MLGSLPDFRGVDRLRPTPQPHATIDHGGHTTVAFQGVRAGGQVDVDDHKTPQHKHDQGVDHADGGHPHPVHGVGHNDPKPVCLVVQTVEHYAAEHLDQAHDVNAGVGELLQWIVREVKRSFFLQEQVVLYGAPQSFDVLVGVEGPEAAPSKLAVFGGEG